MILLFGNSDDALVAAVSRLLRARGLAAARVSEQDLFSAPFAFEQRGRQFAASLRLEGREVDFNDDVSAVLLRLARTWWPPDFDMQDGVFVYHESNAAWFALLAGLNCRMVNSPALAAWVQDLTYPEALVRDLAERLALPAGDPPPAIPGLGRLLPTAPPATGEGASFYAVDGELIARSPADQAFVGGISASALRDWQQANEVRLCRLDFENHGDSLRLMNVEVHPFVDDEPGELVDRVAAAVAEVLA